MAKYTETLTEWLEAGNELPAALSDISEDFPSLFLARYAIREIGFETRYLFGVKLEATAARIAPIYKALIAELMAAKTSIAAPEKYTKVNVGKQKATTTELPIDSAESAPSGIVENDAYETGTIASGSTPDEAMRQADWLLRKRDLLSDALKEFEPLFMQVF